MAKRCSLLDINDKPSTSQKPVPINWAICIICQEDYTEGLRCPYKSKRKDKGAGYKSLAEDLSDFHAIGHLPPSINLDLLDEGEGLEATFLKHSVSFHKNCRDKYNKSKLSRQTKKRHLEDDTNDCVSKCTRSALDIKKESESVVCFFCDETDILSNVCTAQTFALDRGVRDAAELLKDTKLLAKLSSGDMIAIEAKYHKTCLVNLYNRIRSHNRQTTRVDDGHSLAKSIALAQLISYMNEMQLDSSVAPVYKLSDLVKLYNNRLEQFGVLEKVHATRFREKLLEYIPGLTAHKQGKQVLLAYDVDVGQALIDACRQNTDNDALCMANCADIIRGDLFDSGVNFEGSFPSGCQEKSVPASLVALLQMIMQGSGISDQMEKHPTQAVMSVAQIIKFNSHKKLGGTIQHSRNQETPLPLYLGIMIHTQTRKRGIIDKLFNLGLCVSYDRVLRLSSDLSTAVCNHFQHIGVVCPPSLKHNVFTTGVVDNIDHNPSSTTSSGSFHGTGISLIQHPDVENDGTAQIKRAIQASNSKSIAPLPNFYTSVTPVMKGKDPQVPVYDVEIASDGQSLQSATEEETEWLQLVMKQVNKEEQPTNISWSAYHAEHDRKPVKPICRSTLLPLFPDVAHSEAMIRHAMEVVSKAIHYLNPGQVPVLACDQPLFAIAKKIQWTWPETHGEKIIVVMLGGLHIEMAILKTMGTWLDGSGWTEALVQANVASPGTADSFIQCAHITKTRYAHQVTAASLYTLKQQAFQQYIEGAPGEPLTYSTWSSACCKSYPTFQYWSQALEMEVLLLAFLRSLRESSFHLYIDTLMELGPWFFALDKTHYARWVSVHIRDMISLQAIHPNVLEEFIAGKFTMQKTNHKFSAIALDQAHEQNNEMIKGDGGAIGLTQNESALRRWMVSGPEMAQLVQEFEYGSTPKNTGSDAHHDQNKAVQEKFKKNVQDFTLTIQEYGNPFMEQSGDLINLTSKDILNPSTVNIMRSAKNMGETQFKEFVKDRLGQRCKSVNDPLPRNNITVFKDKPLRSKTSMQNKLTAAKNDCKLFSKLYIACQHRNGDLEDFFKYENQASPPSLSDSGQLRSGTKSDLLTCLGKFTTAADKAPEVSAIVIDGAALVQMLKPERAKTFSEYSRDVFIPYVHGQLQHCERVDVVFDEYRAQSLKASTRQRRGKGKRRRVEPNVRIPHSWQDFLRCDENKTELFKYLAHELSINSVVGKIIIATSGQNVLCTPNQDFSNLAPCCHEEADTRIVVHVVDSAKMGHKKILIHTVDTDVVALAVFAYSKLNLEELWIAFGTGRNFRYLPAHDYAAYLGSERSEALPAFHAFTGCDTVSCFSGHGKKTAWETWTTYPQATAAFLELVRCPKDVSSECMATLERFVILMYDRTSTLLNVNEARKYLFTKRNRSIDNIPPTYAAFTQHVRRAAYQAGHIWGQAMKLMPCEPPPTDWGWTEKNGSLSPLWSTLNEAASSCYELIHCGCKTGCQTKLCKCVRAELQCTSLCGCDGECHRD